ncbi:MAG: pyridoxal phosphate-dependent aminotransferase [Prevotellaceae bacterium]|jgi:cystathionine beta-lyase|nr:pyridoxal phosphate-dependent aminotransferase [Prevotellaceae bacterium]
MNYNFDEIIDRHNTNALKTDALLERYGDKNLLPMWVADMDFATPKPIVDALKLRLEHRIFGYTQTPESFFAAIVNWLKIRQNFDVKREWISYIPGIVKGIGLAINVFSEVGDKIIIQTPVYHLFKHLVEKNERIMVENPLKLVDNQYEMDFSNLEKIIDEKCKILILSNPQNPSGKVWEKQTLQKLAEICQKHKILVISDEIHADLTLFGNRFHPFAAVSDVAKNNSITFQSPSKTFNIAGIVSSFSVVPNEKLREKFYNFLIANELNEPTIFSIIAAETAYNFCGDYLTQLTDYLEDNINFVESFLQKEFPKIKMMKPQASFLVWLDCRELGLNHAELVDFFVKKAKLALNDGEMFGSGGEGFMRMNIAVPRKILEQALNNLLFTN